MAPWPNWSSHPQSSYKEEELQSRRLGHQLPDLTLNLRGADSRTQCQDTIRRGRPRVRNMHRNMGVSGVPQELSGVPQELSGLSTAALTSSTRLCRAASKWGAPPEASMVCSKFSM